MKGDSDLATHWSKPSVVSYFSQGSSQSPHNGSTQVPSPDPHYLCGIFATLFFAHAPTYIHTGFLAVPSETNTLLCILALALPGMFFPRYLHGPLPHPTQSLLKYIVSSERTHLTTYSVSPSSLLCFSIAFVAFVAPYHLLIYYFFSQIKCKFHEGRYFHQFCFLMYHRAQRRLLIKIFD